MKSDSTRNKRKVLVTLLLCIGFIAGHPCGAMANGSDQNQQTTQQQVQVRGVVKDELGEPVIGTSIVVKGTSNGVITDLNGEFSITVQRGAVLQISYMGYVPQEIKTEVGKALLITMKEDAQALDEVVVVGFGTQKKK